MQFDLSKPSPRGAFFVQAVDRTIFRLGFFATLASLCVLASAQVAPSSAPAPASRQQSVLPNSTPKAVSHKPDDQESKKLLQMRANHSRGFIENKGQWPSDVKFMGRSNGLDLWVTNEGLRVNAFAKTDARVTGHVVGVQFVGGNKLQPVGHAEVGVRTDFLGTQNTARGARTFGTVKSDSIYPNILLKNYFEGSKPRYDFVVKPNGNPALIEMKYIAATGVKVQPKKLTVKTSVGDIIENELAAYQIVNGKKVPVVVSFRNVAKNTVGFKVGSYDHSKQLVIDPLVYGSYYGGDSGMDEVHAVVSDLAGGVYMTGSTMAPDFPAIFGPYSFTLRGDRDAFISKLEGDVYRHDYAAFLGGNKDDTGEFLQLDQFGDLWVAGYTNSPNFPGANGANVQYLTYDSDASFDPPARSSLSMPSGAAHFRVNLGRMTATFSGNIPWNASPAQLQTVLQTYINGFTLGQTVTVDGLGDANITAGRGYKVTFSSGIIGNMTVDNNFLGAVYSSRPRIVDGKVQILTKGISDPTTGVFNLSVQYSRSGGTFLGQTSPLPYNATPAAIRNAINTLIADPSDPNQGNVNMGAMVATAVQGTTGPLPGLAQAIIFPGPEPAMIFNQGTLDIPYLVIRAGYDDFFWNPTSASPSGPGFSGGPPPDPNPDGASWNLSVGGTWTNPVVRYNTTAQQLHDAISTTGVKSGDVFVWPGDGVNTMPFTNMLSIYVGNLLGQFAGPIAISDDPVFIGNVLDVKDVSSASDGRTNPRPVYTVHSESTCFLMRFKQDPNTFLNPLPTKTYFFGGAIAPVLSGFRIIPHDNPVPGEPIRFAFGGTSFDANEQLPQVPGSPRGGGAAPAGFILRINYTDASGFAVVAGASQYIDAYDSTQFLALPIIVGGIDVDTNGNVYVGGTIRGLFGNTTDTSQMTANNDFIFKTTAVDALGTLRDGRLLRYWDQFARKYNASGSLSYSVLVGGDGADDGFGIAVDALGDAYLLGRSRSFNFPRTRGVYGETFTAGLVSTVSKLNPTGTDLIYGTNLRTANTVTPIGIAVDARGIAFMTFSLSRGTIFNLWTVANDPNLCDAFEFVGSVPLTGDALIGGTYAGGPAGGDYGSTDSALLVLNPSGTALLYGTRLGGDLDDTVYRPFVDKGGDVWVCGWTDTFRDYIRPARWAPTIYEGRVKTQLPASMISSLAFRPLPDPNNNFNGPGSTDVGYVGYNNEQDFFPVNWDQFKDRDGFVTRLRIGLASVASVAFNPATIPGGLGASTSGVVTLSQGAPAGGAVIPITMPANASASFDPTQSVTTTSITIPAGGTAGAFTVYSRPVSDNTPVDVTASYQGNFKVGRFVVTPWLQSFTVTPQEVVGGNTVAGRVQLAGVAGSLGLNVQVTSDNTSVVPIQNITVPANQNAVVFNINTNGVDADTTVTLNASLLGVGKTFQLIVHPAQLKALTFAPSPVTSGSSTLGTLVLNGKPGPTGFDVSLAIAGSPAGYSLSTNQLTFPSGVTSQTFTLNTPYEDATVNQTVNATMIPKAGYTPNTIAGTVSVTADSIVSLFFSKNPVKGGDPLTGTVTLATAALAGGARVNISVTPNNGVVTIPATITIPVGQTSATFNVVTTTTITAQNFVVTVSRGGSSVAKTLFVQPLTFTISIPSLIASGSPANGTITLSGPAPAGGVAVTLTSSSPTVVAVPNTLTIAAGQTTATFPMVVSAVANDTLVTISAKIGTTTNTASTTIHASQLLGMTLMPSYVLNLQTTRCTITLDGPAPAGGLNVALTSTNALIASVPTSVKVPAGASSITFSIVTRRVTRPLTTTITGTSSAGQVSAALTVHN
jgi:hypothetical protein